MRKPTLAKIYSKVPSANCKGLCGESCGVIPLMPAEMHLAARTEHVLEGMMLWDAGRNCCPFLVENKCSIYEERPMMCRLWGATEKMPCVFGCEPERILSEEYTVALMRKAMRLK